MPTRRFARPDGPAPALGPAVGVVLCGLVAVIWLANPYAAALLLPAAHLWLLVATGAGRVRGGLGVAALLAGLVPLALVPLHFAGAWGADPLGLARTTLLAIAGGHLSPGTSALLCGLIAVVACLARTLARPAARPRQDAGPGGEPPPRIVTRGPLSYAGPGSLGGTDSALRRY